MFFTPLRKAGASVRLMLEQAAANEWGVDVSECKAQNHEVVHSSGKALGFGYLAEKAAALPLPEESAIKLKSPKDFRYISKQSTIVDLKDIVTGKAKFGLDNNLPETKIAVIRRNPEPGASLKAFSGDKASKVPGVIKVFTLDAPGFPTNFNKPLGGVVVVAENTWAALEGRKALDVTWSKGINGDYNSGAYANDMLRRAKTKGKPRRENGQVDKGLATAKKVIEADYIVPHLAHTALETAPEILWRGAFKQLINTAVEAGFADQRTYVYKGNDVDHQVHLGFDLASTAAAPVRAANRGRVLHAGWLGIYGNCVILDHGMGLQSLYAHLSSISVSTGQLVDSEAEVGRSGATGLAGGDHLHFTMLLDGNAITPIDWWSGQWVQDRVLRKFADAGLTAPAQ
jgi:murein DD-endopeptidase MepM/ murein hydrolase activator NlpD